MSVAGLVLDVLRASHATVKRSNVTAGAALGACTTGQATFAPAGEFIHHTVNRAAVSVAGLNLERHRASSTTASLINKITSASLGARATCVGAKRPRLGPCGYVAVDWATGPVARIFLVKDWAGHTAMFRSG